MIGRDVWIGQGVRILPVARIGDGVIVGAGAVVGCVIAPYTIVVGNPACARRMRFDATTISQLCALAWWDWPIDHILRHEAAIVGADLPALQAAAQGLGQGDA